MAKIEKFENKKKGDKLAAYLALAAEDKEQPQEGCLGPEELADVAAGLCTPEQREKAIGHFSSCRTCYDNWVAVSFSLAAMERGSTPARRSLLTVRNLGYLGSAFAVAASVVVFLNIREGALESQLVSPPPYEETAVSNEVISTRVSENKRVMSTMTDSTDGRVEQEIEVDETGKRAAAPVAAGKYSAGEKPPAENAGELVMEETPVVQDRAAETVVSAALPPTVLEAGDWLEHIYGVCENPSPEQAFWTDLRKEGETLLLVRDENSLSGSRRTAVEEVVKLLAAADGPDKIAAQCDKIRRFLAQELDKE